MAVLFRVLSLLALVAPSLLPGETPGEALLQEKASTPVYYWRDLNVGGTAVLSTLFCHSPAALESPVPDQRAESRDIPLIAVLKDTLGDSNPENDRLTYVWLLTYKRPSWGQRILSAIPLFYWHFGNGSDGGRQHDVSPLLDLASPEHPMLADFRHDLMQWTALDPSFMAIRATSRTYRTNEVDHERLHIEEAASYLRKAPVSEDGIGLTLTQVNVVIARLELRKKLLGGFVSQKRTAQLGERAAFQEERIRMRNWELLRECAEKTGLVFQPLDVGTTPRDYAMLSFPADETLEPSGTSLSPVWKLLGISNPWRDGVLRKDRGAQNAPLAIYSLNYSKAPLLMIDFRSKKRVRWHEVAQRSINEITAGIIGLSHFTNWYYYVAADLYDFYAGRHGAAVDQAARLDCYAQFRVELAMDTHLDRKLRNEMQQHIESLEINPLESNPQREIAAAWARYAQLEQEARPNGPLLERIDKDRRRELASFGESGVGMTWYGALHELTFGAYTHRAKEGPAELEQLDRNRRVDYELAFLDSLTRAGTRPEVTYNSAHIEKSISELGNLLPNVHSRAVTVHATETLEKLKQLSFDAGVQADCSRSVALLGSGSAGTSGNDSSSTLGLSLSLSSAQEIRRP